MADIHLTREFAAHADTVWQRVGDTAGVADWIPAIGSSRQEADVRHVVFTDGQPARERIVSHDDTARTYTYSYIDGPLPLEHYESTMTVTPSDDGTSVVTWSAEFGAASAEVEEALTASISEIYAAALDELQSQLAR